MWTNKTYFAFSLENKPGELARFTEQLRVANIDLLGMWGYAGGEQRPRLSCVPADADAFERFATDAGLDIEVGETYYLAGSDEPGALMRSLRQISEAGINIDAVEAVAGAGSFGCFLWADQAQWNALKQVLEG